MCVFVWCSDSRRRPRLLDCRERRSSVEWWIPEAELVLRLRLTWGLRPDRAAAAAAAALFYKDRWKRWWSAWQKKQRLLRGYQKVRWRLWLLIGFMKMHTHRRHKLTGCSIGRLSYVCQRAVNWFLGLMTVLSEQHEDNLFLQIRRNETISYLPIHNLFWKRALPPS